MLLSLFFFTANVLVIKGLSLKFAAVDGWAASLFRGAAGLGFLLAVYGSRGLDLKAALKQPKLIARGVVGAIAILLFYISIVHLGVGRATIINLTYPLFGVVLAAIFLKEPLGLRPTLWLIAGFAGLLLFFSEAAFSNTLSGYDFIGVLSAVGAGVAVVLIRGLSKDHHPSTIYAAQCIYAVLLTVPVAGIAIFSLPLVAWAVLILGAVLVAVGQIAITIGFTHLSVAKGSSIQMLLPLLVAGSSFFLFEETMEVKELLGAVITLFATWQVLRSPVTRKQPAAATAPATS